MIQKVTISDNKKAPFHYIQELGAFKNGTTYEFKSGVNIIVGKNGCGKSTLMKLIQSYLMVGYEECDRGSYNINVRRLYGFAEEIPDGIDVYADYDKNTFRVSHFGEKSEDDTLRSFRDFGTTYVQSHSSTGEGIKQSMYSLFQYIFSDKVNLKYDYGYFKKLKPDYADYIDRHRIDDPDNEWTILMDEPDRNLSIDNINDLKGILSCHKPNTQIIAVIHNPLLLYWLKRHIDVNIIEMSKGYMDEIEKFVKKYTK